MSIILDAVDYRNRQGWYADPFGAHESRYFSAGKPTKLVRDGHIESYDEPPTEGVELATAAASAEDSAPWAMAMAGPASTGVVPTNNSTVSPGDILRAPDDHPVPMRPRRSGRGWLASAVVVIVVAGVVLGAAKFLGLVEPAGGDPAALDSVAFVKTAAERTLAAKTADFTVSATVQVSDQTITLTGNGQLDLTDGDQALSLAGSVPGGSLSRSTS